MRILFYILLLSGLTIPGLAQRESFEFEGLRIRSGSSMQTKIQVTAHEDSTFIPITIIHGKHPGPVLGLIAGIHGYEYPPIIALQRLVPDIDPDQLRGTVILVHIANVPSFLGRSVYYNPLDGKNLNRCFPGNPNGTISERMAWIIGEKILSRCQYLVDIHAGDASEDLHPYVAYYEVGEKASEARRMAYALNFPWVIISENIPQVGRPTMYCSAESVSRGIVTAAIEYGKLGNVTGAEADFINTRLINMMRVMSFLPGKPEKTLKPVEIRKRISITAPTSGIFYSEFRSADRVRKGDVIGRITDFYGNELQTIIAPANGFIIYKLATPPVNKGEVLFSLASND